VYYGVHIAAVLAFFVLWARATGQRLAVMVRPVAVVLGLVFALLLGLVVVGTEPSTTGPQGLALAWALLWRGVAYGAADGLLLSGEQHHGRHEHQQVDQAAPHRPLPNDQVVTTGPPKAVASVRATVQVPPTNTPTIKYCGMASNHHLTRTKPRDSRSGGSTSSPAG